MANRTSKAFPRSRRVAQQIQRALSDLIRREIRDPRVGMVTLTEVRVSSDLSYATIYYSVLNAKPEEAHEVLSGPVAEMLRGPLGRALSMRHAPELRFVQDELIEGGARLSALINKAVKADVERHVETDAGQKAEDDQDVDESDPDDKRSADPDPAH